uniref:Uncharacterized protein n=1 Tax=Heterosigma akashiwo TaxID=2829 RepID=A0A6V1UY01_HETAK
MAAQKAEEDRLAAEKQAEEDRLAVQKEEEERLAAEQQADKEQLAAVEKADNNKEKQQGKTAMDKMEEHPPQMQNAATTEFDDSTTNLVENDPWAQLESAGKKKKKKKKKNTAS